MNAPETRQEALSLSQLNKLFKSTINPLFATPFLVCAEIQEVKDTNAGKQYSFIEPLIDNKGERRLSVRGFLWKNNFQNAVADFVSEIGKEPEQKMKVMFWAKATFNDYTGGMQLEIQSFDPTWTLGEVEAQRRKIRKELQEKGLFQQNKSLPVPTSFAKVVVITGADTQGANDFRSKAGTLHEYELTLFRYLDAKMQGPDMENSICQAFDKAWQIHRDNLLKDNKGIDAIVLIRGGGDSAHLDQFTNLNIALKVATSPVPVFIGIGHQNDSCILDEIACKSFGTPSMAAAAFVDASAQQAEREEALLSKFIQLATDQRALHEELLGKTRGKLVARASDQLDDLAKRHTSAKQIFIGQCAPAVDAIGANLSRIRNGLFQSADACQRINEAAVASSLKQMLSACTSRLDAIESHQLNRRTQALCQEIRDRAEAARRAATIPAAVSPIMLVTFSLAILLAGFALLIGNMAFGLLAGFTGCVAVYLWRQRRASNNALKFTIDNRYELLLQHIKNLETTLH